ncbi:MAG: hypothetical protein NVSMB31_19370 [Vulcanimicrobiaceae bacterium]
MVDRILARVEEPCLSGVPYIIWGIVGGGTDVLTQIVVIQNGAPSLLWLSAVLMLAAVGFMIWDGMRKAHSQRRGLLDRHIGMVFIISWVVSLVVMMFANHIFAYWAQGAIWSLMFGAAMMYTGSLARSRISFSGGVILIASILAANFTPHYVGYVLAAGFLAGMGGAGVALALARGNE